MGDELKFQQRWEFRKRDNDLESSSDDSESHSAFKKHKLVSSFISCEDNETNDSPALQLDAETNPDTGKQNENVKARKVRHGWSKKDKLAFNGMEKGSRKGNTKTRSYAPVLELNGLKMFMESLLDDLKGTRENLLARMKDEMNKLVADGNVFLTTERECCNGEENFEARRQNQPESHMKVKRSVKGKKAAVAGNGQATGCTKSTKKDKGAVPESSLKANFEVNPSDQNGEQQLHSNFGVTTQAQNCNGRFQEVFVQYRKNFDSGNSHKVLQNHADLDQVARPISPTGKVREETSGCSSNPYDQNALMQHQNNLESGIRFATPIEKDIGKSFGVSLKPSISSNPSGQLDSSMYLTLPTVLTEPHFDNNTSSYSYMQSIISGNRMNVNSERAIPMLDASARHQYFPSLQQEERFRKFTPMSSRNITQNSSIGSGLLPVPLHQSMDGGFSIPSQVSLDNHSRDILGLRMNGGAVRFSGENHTLPGHYFSNNFNNHLNYKADSGLISFQAPSFMDGHIPPK